MLLLGLAIIWFSEIRSLSFNAKEFHRIRNMVRDRVESMAVVLGELIGDRIDSAKHARARLEFAADNGVVWPGAIFAVLDDVENQNARSKPCS